MAKAIIVGDLKYKSPKRTGRGTGHKGLAATLKYLEYREDRDTRANSEQRQDRWQDCGLGAHYRAIFQACDHLQSQHVLAWTWVISPAPDLMALVPQNQRRTLVMDVTERVVEAYYEARHYQIPPFSYVIHDRLTANNAQQIHSHVILPGLASTIEGWEPFYINQRQHHDQLFNDIAHEQFEQALDRTIGREWRQLRAEPDIMPDLSLDTDELDHWFPR